MTAALINFVSQFLSLSWLTGPIFDKELRVSSRRRRNYVLRFVYLALLTLFLVLIWLEEVKIRGSAAYRISRMARAGQTIVLFIIWFQFCATQLIAVIMLSTSISDEIYNRTLGVLMTTPISSFQIVIGKLFSKLLQLILLLAISLPLLAIVRVFGGVPWHYVITSLCITLTAIIFVGSLSLFFSILSRRAYVVIIMTILTLAVLFALLPFLVAMLWHTLHLRPAIPESTILTVLLHPNPYGVLAVNTEAMMSPRGGTLTFSWLLHCGIMLAGSIFVLALSVIKVRKVALRQATGQLGTSFRKNKVSDDDRKTKTDRHPKRVKGPPVLWKELRHPLFRGHKLAAFIIIAIALILLATTYLLFAIDNNFDDDDVHMAFTSIFLSLGMLFTIILPATCITSEKESRSWPLLLSTTLGDWQIIFGKFIGVLRRCLPIWILLFGHVIVFSFLGYIHPVAIVMTAILSTWIIVLFISTGIYFSTRFKRTTTAVVMNFVLPIIIWALVPFLLALSCVLTNLRNDFAVGYINIIPFVPMIVIFDETSGWPQSANQPLGEMLFNWPKFELGPLESIIFMLAFMVAYIFIAYLFLWRAKCRIRRNIF
jgi:ABC-type transport system involved in multi-copper enzyme maturation permease subunit